MKIKILIGIMCLNLFYGCGCSDEETINYDLNEFESSLISMESQDNIQFINQEQELINAKTTTKTTENKDLNSSDNDSCTVVLAESQENDLIIETLGKTFTTEIEKREDNKSHIVVSDGTLFYGIDNLDTENLEEITTSFSSDGFDFNNVFVLNSGSDSGFVIYSTTKGIEFIKNDDGSFLRRTE
ncbi:hypothetical protein HPE56_19330 [Maribacter sp. ANRC-HE7]|uniref:Uncharacterized protein n=1 Tax=Maribacter aquimaris TaxID=2737171 RepID=A0ABR7V8I2_9FLAO|nr:hypothetical protein [Maribacter aquimaris]MBD0779956.1 hypothetical protein [Maribacter aquimaris]